MFARPSATTGEKYEGISAAYSKAVHNVITGRQDPHQAVLQLNAKLMAIMQSPGREPVVEKLPEAGDIGFR